MPRKLDGTVYTKKVISREFCQQLKGRAELKY